MPATYTLPRPLPLGSALRSALPWGVLALCLAASGVVGARVVEGDGRLATFGLYLTSTGGYLRLLGLRRAIRPRPRPSWTAPAAFALTQLDKLQERFPGGRMVTEVDGRKLERHAVWLPRRGDYPPGTAVGGGGSSVGA
ncbi:MAG TPA: hypothetical protein VG370_19045 [Chloroflexota bacterium]|jgi:hypothetical protein|nr:hypothetical protein [Chloroflexota bacterium]